MQAWKAWDALVWIGWMDELFMLDLYISICPGSGSSDGIFILDSDCCLFLNDTFNGDDLKIQQLHLWIPARTKYEFCLIKARLDNMVDEYCF